MPCLVNPFWDGISQMILLSAKQSPYRSSKRFHCPHFGLYLLTHVSLLITPCWWEICIGRSAAREVRCPQRTTCNRELLRFTEGCYYRLSAEGSGSPGKRTTCENELLQFYEEIYNFKCSMAVECRLSAEGSGPPGLWTSCDADLPEYAPTIVLLLHSDVDYWLYLRL